MFGTPLVHVDDCHHIVVQLKADRYERRVTEKD